MMMLVCNIGRSLIVNDRVNCALSFLLNVFYTTYYLQKMLNLAIISKIICTIMIDDK